ncbi:Ger(x)C family spore germination protein [Paenibacillus tyrfis]|uniref:Ger(x)C family spore germination protein n=1 Tax=Paenibacillus tyrfis TaxID=1501230 RepID=UPI00209E9BA6|nr:Ger(x)C family spore germination protein [Paenibacillus tyrfis]MCP1308319.1 Ger(x)C family spore germination protein [Paenibacillus tyrfis]
MQRIALLILCHLIMVSTLTGCWSRRELNDISIVVGMGIDKQDGEYSLSAQVVIPEAVSSKQGAGGGIPTSILQSTAPTMVEAIRKMLKTSPRYFYLSHLRVLVISEEVAREGIQDILDFFSRDNELRADFYILLAKGQRAEEILSVVTRLEKSQATKLFKSLEWNRRLTGETANVFLDELLANLTSTGKMAVLSGVEIVGNKKQAEQIKNVQKTTSFAHFKMTSIGVFKDDKLIGWLNESESRSYNYITGKIRGAVERVACPKKDSLDLRVNQVESKIKANVVKGKPQGRVDLFIETDVSEVNCVIDLDKPESLYALEKKLTEKLQASLRQVVRKAQKTYGSDIFGFGNAIHRANPKAWKKLSKNWKKEFVKMPVAISVEVKVRRTGTQSNSFINDIQKKKEQ